ncbi:MAG: hypothetical protein ACFCVD_02645 [Nodosilinea sp.]
MWQPLKNFVDSLTTYGLLSPDLAAQARVNRWLKSRPYLNHSEWYGQYWMPPAVAAALPQPLVEFVYVRLQVYSGLEMGRVLPSDRLMEDLQFPAVCWFNWGQTLCEDFQATFGLDIADQFDETQFVTCADLMTFLGQQLASVEPPSP